MCGLHQDRHTVCTKVMPPHCRAFVLSFIACEPRLVESGVLLLASVITLHHNVSQYAHCRPGGVSLCQPARPQAVMHSHDTPGCELYQG